MEVSVKDSIINNILCVMAAKVQADILQTLDNAMRRELYNFDVQPLQTGIVVYDNTNDRMLQIFAANKKLENLRQETISQYILYNRKFLECIGKPYTDVTTEDAKFWLSDYSTRVCANTVSNAKRYLSSFFTWLHDNGYISKNIIRPIRNIKTDPPKKEHLTDEEIEMIRDNCRTPREIALVDLLLSTGLRVGELTALKIEDIDFLRGRIVLRSEKSRKFRTVYLDAKAKKHLIEYINSRPDINPALFVHDRTDKNLGMPKSLKKSGVEIILKDIAARAGVKKKCTVHIYRRTLATILLRRGVKLEYIKEILGHASTATTESHYASIIIDDVENEYRRAFAA